MQSLSFCLCHCAPLGIGAIALPSQRGQWQQTTRWLPCPQGQALVLTSVCISFRVQIKMHQWRPLEQANKITRVLQTPGRRLTPGKERNHCEEPGLALGGRWRQWEAEAGQAAGCPQHGSKSYTHADTLAWVPWTRTVRGNCPFLPFSKLFVPNWSHMCLGCIGEQTCGLEGPERALSALTSPGTVPAHGGPSCRMPGLCKTVLPGAPVNTEKALHRKVPFSPISSFRLASLCHRWKVICDRKMRHVGKGKSWQSSWGIEVKR